MMIFKPIVEEKYVTDESNSDEGLSQDSDGDKLDVDWKPPRFQSFETIGLTSTAANLVVRPHGFRTDGTLRTIKKTCMLGRMKKLQLLSDTAPKLAVCITMYNENEEELKLTMRGVIQNYNAMYMDPDIKMRQKDFIVVCVVDGLDKIPQSFRKYASES